MSDKKAPKIEFPCENYVIKVVGEAQQEMIDFVLETTKQFAPEFDQTNIKIKQSAKGRFHSITLYIIATGEKQLQDYHQALIANPQVKMVI